MPEGSVAATTQAVAHSNGTFDWQALRVLLQCEFVPLPDCALKLFHEYFVTLLDLLLLC